MSRTARERTSTNVYHAVMRGVNKQQIFECSEDYRRFISIPRQQTNEVELRSNIISEPSLADEEYYTYIDAGSFEQYPDYWRIRYLSLDPCVP